MKKINKNKKLILLIILVLTLATGCATTLVDKKKQPVKNEVTGQTLTKNILCQPTDKESIKKYKANKVKIEKLPKCEDFKISSGKYEGIWSTIFVKPLSYLILKFGLLTKSYAVSIILVLLLIRLVTFPFTQKATKQSKMMQQIQPEMQRIQAKYAGKKDEESMSKQSQEMMMLYKKYNVNPISGCLVSFLQLPIFIAFYEAVQRVPAIFEDSFLGIQLGTTPLVGFSKSHFYLYIILILIIAASTFYSFIIGLAGSNNDNNMKSMPIFMTILIVVTALFMPSALCIYWIFNNIFTIIQTKLVKTDSKKGRK